MILMNENFKQWFKKSKIVGADKQPLVVYHGTIHEFDSFDTTSAELICEYK